MAYWLGHGGIVVGGPTTLAPWWDPGLTLSLPPTAPPCHLLRCPSLHADPSHRDDHLCAHHMNVGLQGTMINSYWALTPVIFAAGEVGASDWMIGLPNTEMEFPSPSPSRPIISLRYILKESLPPSLSS